MRTKSTGGFTLIELLIVIAIIGILAAVLIPNLMSARRLAQDRAAQSYSSQVYTAINAWLAQSPTHGPGHSDWVDTCGGEFNIGTAPNVFTVNSPGSALATANGCSIHVDDDTGDIEVRVTSVNGAYFVNGQESTPSAG